MNTHSNKFKSTALLCKVKQLVPQAIELTILQKQPLSNEHSIIVLLLCDTDKLYVRSWINPEDPDWPSHVANECAQIISLHKNSLRINNDSRWLLADQCSNRLFFEQEHIGPCFMHIIEEIVDEHITHDTISYKDVLNSLAYLENFANHYKIRHTKYLESNSIGP